MKTLDEYIKVIPNILSNDLCDAILQEYKDSDEWEPALVSYNNVTDTAHRNVATIGISLEKTINKNKNIRQEIDSNVFDASKKVIEVYRENHYFEVHKDSGYDLLRYEVGCFFNTHIDAGQRLARTISCSFILNDEYVGGEWAFFGGELKLRPPKGSAVIFPSNFLFPHAITTVTAGTRYSIVTWFH